jgi:hypothetical protein
MNTVDSFSSINEICIEENDTPKSNTSLKNAINDNGITYTIEIPVETDNDNDNDMNSKIDKALQGTRKNEKSKQNSDTNSIEQHLNDVIKKLRERVIIYEYMCFRTNSLYSILNKCFLVPSICLSSGLALFNSNYFKNTEDNNITVFNVVGNGILTLMIALQNAFKFGEKSDYFFNMKKKFSKLHNTLNNEIINQISNLRINQTKLLEFMTEYDHLDQSIHYEFPRHIIIDTRKKFSHYSLPTICNGVEVVEEEVQPRDPNKHAFTGILRSNKKKIYQINL